MLKGQSKIELFDARTGEKQAEYKNKNLITNAVSKILNMNDDLGLFRLAKGCDDVASNNQNNYGVFSTCNPLLQALPLARRAFGGVYLFNEAIEENVNTVMPPDGTKCVGYAGSQYSGDDTFRGTHNNNESGEILDTNNNVIGYRHVWDFGTDKGNGTVNCLGLTSQYGGDFGLKANLSDCEYFPFSSGYFSGENTYNRMSHNNDLITVATKNSLSAFYAKNESDGTITIFAKCPTAKKVYKVVLAQTSSFAITQNLTKVRSETELISTLDTLNSNIYIYNNLIHEIYRSTTNTITHKTYSLTGVLQNTVNITTPSDPYNDNVSVPFYFNNYYYYHNSNAYNVLQKINASGELISTITLPISNSMQLGIMSVRINEKLNQIEALLNFNIGTVQDKLLTIDVNDNLHTTSYYYNSSNNYVAGFRDAILSTSTNDCFAYISSGPYPETVNELRLHPYIDMRYLASINNLATPVTKTSAQVMKITYELTETT